MGEAAARKVTEIEETRRALEADLQDLEDRMPAALRSVKALAGVLVGTAAGVFVLKKLVSRHAPSAPAAEVVVRIVHEDGRAEVAGSGGGRTKGRR
jgi:hypothetical protein